jgi:hypothetical protein
MREGKDTGSVRDHLSHAAKGSGKAAASARAKLAEHTCPAVFRTLWRHFIGLSGWRGSGGMGPSALTLADVSAYEARYEVTFLAGELDLLKQLDALTLAPSP